MGDQAQGLSQWDLIDLRRWYEEYVVADPFDEVDEDGLPAVLQVLDQDVPDTERIEQQISKTVLSMPDFEIFCDECREALDHWPGLNAHRYVRRSTTIAVQAAARKGCRFCSFILQVLIDDASFHTFQRIEERLQGLGECEQFTVRASSYHGSGWSHIEPPGRAGLRSLLATRFNVFYLDPAGK